MNLEHQVCSLELANKLKELRIKQKSLFNYWPHKDSYQLIYTCRNYKEKKFISAFTVAELGELLPAIINGAPLEMIKSYDLTCTKPMYCTRYFNAGLIMEPETNEANSRAKMLIYLIENNLYKG